VFGKLRVDRSHRGDRFSVRKKGDLYVYRRGDREVKLVTDSLELFVRPMPPVNLPDRITDMFIVDYPELHVGPDKRIIEFLKVPIEVAVLFRGEPIDVFGFAREEFVLYGQVDEGRVARRVDAEVVEPDRLKWDGESGVIPLRIKNYTKAPVRNSRLVLDSTFLETYYDGERVAFEMVKLDFRETPRVRYMNRNHFKGMHKIEAKGQAFKKEEVMELIRDHD
jgi:hypothetical protein